MDENPYAAPQAEIRVEGVNSGSVEDLRKVANAQRGIIIAILVYIFAVFSQFALPPELVLIAGLAGLAAGIGGLVCTIILAVRVYSLAVGIVLGVLCLVPCVGLIVLLVVNQKATSVLKQNGIGVGIAGARMRDFDRLGL